MDFKVWSQCEDDASVFKTQTPEQAIQLYATMKDRQGVYNTDYPSGQDIFVEHENGTIETYTLDTMFTPVFIVEKKK